MLTNEIIEKIEKFVEKEPRSVQEIAEFIDKSWKTADRYIEEIKHEKSSITTKTLRSGIKGSMKIVFFKQNEKISSGIFQEELEKEIEIAKDPRFFSAFEIYQHIDKSKKFAIIEGKTNAYTNLEIFNNALKNTKSELRIFSGNLSLINAKNEEKGINIFKTIEELVKKGIKIKAITRISFDSKENVEKLLSLNYKYGSELIEIKHNRQALRVTIFDDESFNIKEVIHSKEMKEELKIYYTIQDKKWTKWMTKIFNSMFLKSVSHQKRFEELKEFEI